MTCLNYCNVFFNVFIVSGCSPFAGTRNLTHKRAPFAKAIKNNWKINGFGLRVGRLEGPRVLPTGLHRGSSCNPPPHAPLLRFQSRVAWGAADSRVAEGRQPPRRRNRNIKYWRSSEPIFGRFQTLLCRYSPGKEPTKNNSLPPALAAREARARFGMASFPW